MFLIWCIVNFNSVFNAINSIEIKEILTLHHRGGWGKGRGKGWGRGRIYSLTNRDKIKIWRVTFFKHFFIIFFFVARLFLSPMKVDDKKMIRNHYY